jgi:hypothetical protein
MTSIVDMQHPDTRAPAEITKQRADEERAASNHQRAMAAARQAFDFALRDWKKSRPEYAAVVKLIRTGAGMESRELQVAMATAGLDVTAVNELLILRQRAIRGEPLAKEHRARQAALDRIEQRWADLGRRFETAKTPGERDAIECEIANLEEPRREAQSAALDSRTAADSVELARQIGVI